MKKTLIIIRREYLSRVKKRSFIVMTILGPVLMASLMIVPYFIARYTEKTSIIDVVDESFIYHKNLSSNKTITFNYLSEDIASAKAGFDARGHDALLYIPRPSYTKPTYAVIYYSNKQPGLTVTSYIKDKMKYVLENKTLLDQYGIDKKAIESTKTSITLVSQDIKTGVNSVPALTTFIGIFSGVLIYFFIFMFCSQVMRGVIEEKTNRIVEVIVSSVKPFQLMMGKITGIGLVGLTQFALWIFLTLTIVLAVQGTMGGSTEIKTPESSIVQESPGIQNVLVPDITQQQQEQQGIQTILSSLSGYDFVAILLSFLFFFIFGYLMYAALYAAVGSAVDNEADTQQFMLPITVPLILAFVMAQFIIENPQGPLAFWFSMIPLTSPIVMMIRLPFGIPAWELILSMSLLVLGFLATTWIAGRIYRTGILMYGKKVNYRELWKWLKY
jgi:ABC-2 type transport system permease protein